MLVEKWFNTGNGLVWWCGLIRVVPKTGCPVEAVLKCGFELKEAVLNLRDRAVPKMRVCYQEAVLKLRV